MDDYGGMNLKIARTDVQQQLTLQRARPQSDTPRPFRSIFRGLFVGLLLCSCTSLVAEELLFEAITDFQDINAGEIPYYIDTVGDRNVLAINAANEDYRDRFARAVTSFDGSSGTYDVTITTLGEIDGEGEFRFLVNGELRGSAFNQQVSVDWGEQHHVFENIELDAGDEIAVESNARSNGLIPENGEYAFARGRWRSLGLVLNDDATGITEVVDLSIALEAADIPLVVGDSMGINIVLDNVNTNEVATGLAIELELSPVLSFDSLEGCSIDASETITEAATGSATESTTVICAVAELAPGATAEFYLVVTAVDTGVGSVIASVSSSQADPVSGNNSAQRSFAIDPINVAPLATVNPPVVPVPVDPFEVDSDISGENNIEVSESDNVLASQANSAASSSGSGGGALWWLLPAFATILFRRSGKPIFKSVYQ